MTITRGNVPAGHKGLLERLPCQVVLWESMAGRINVRRRVRKTFVLPAKNFRVIKKEIALIYICLPTYSSIAKGREAREQVVRLRIC